MDRLLFWIFAALLAVLVTLLAADFIRGWRQGRADAEARQKVGHNSRGNEKTPQNAKFDVLRQSRGEAAPRKNAVSKLDTGKNAVSAIDLTGRPRPVFEAKLPPDGAVLHLLPPTKAVADRFAAIGEILQRISKGRHNLEDIEELFVLAAVILNNNKEGIACTTAFVSERCTSEDVAELLTGYMHWLQELLSSKN